MSKNEFWRRVHADRDAEDRHHSVDFSHSLAADLQEVTTITKNLPAPHTGWRTSPELLSDFSTREVPTMAVLLEGNS